VAITASALTSGGDTTAATSYATASITPGANRLVLLAVAGNLTGTAAAPTSVTGNGLTWVQVGHVEYDTSGTHYGFTLFRALGASPSSGAVTITYAASQGSCVWSVLEFDGVDTSGTNGSGAIVQAVSHPVTPPSSAATSDSTTLSAFGSASNCGVGFYTWEANEQGTAGSGLTKLPSTNPGIAGPSQAVMSEYGINQATIAGSWTTSAQWGSFAVEVKASGNTLCNAGVATVAVSAPTPTAATGSPIITQGRWRWFNDVSAPVAGDALAAEETAPTISQAQLENGIVRLRVQLHESGGGADTKALNVQYSEDDTNWQNIASASPAGDTEVFWLRWVNGASTAGATISSQLLTGTTASGTYVENTGNLSVTASSMTEFDLAFKVHWPPPSTTIRLRITWNGTVINLDGGRTQIQLTTPGPSSRRYTIDRLTAISGNIRNQENRFAPDRRHFYVDTYNRWFFFTGDGSETPSAQLRYYTWSGSGAWSGPTAFTVGSGALTGALHKTHMQKVADGEHVVLVVTRQSSSTRYWRRGRVTSGTAITWDTGESNSYASDRHVAVGMDDGYHWWIGGIDAVGGGVWGAASVNADGGASGWSGGFGTRHTASATGVASGDLIGIYGLASGKALFVWANAAGGLQYALCDSSTGFGTVRTLASVAHPNDWGVVRTNGWVYCTHTDNATDSSGSWVGKAYQESDDATGFSAITSPSQSHTSAGGNDGLALGANGNDIYTTAVWMAVEGGQDRKLVYKKYTGPGRSGSWGSLTDITDNGARVNFDYNLVSQGPGAGQIVGITLAGDDAMLGTNFALEYHIIAVPVLPAAASASSAITAPTPAAGVKPAPGAATATVSAPTPRTTVAVSAGVATVGVSAPDPTVSTATTTTVNAGVATVAVSAPAPTIAVSPTAEAATVAAAAPAPSGTVRASAETATVAASAPAATVTTATTTFANAGVATVGVAANGSTVTVRAAADVATAAVAAPAGAVSLRAPAQVASAAVTSPSAKMHPGLATPTRGAFYYSWYDETWTVGGEPIKYSPVLGQYDLDGGGAAAIFDQHIAWLDAAGIRLAILSWWAQDDGNVNLTGTDHNEGTRIPLFLSRIAALGSPLKVAFYYESEGFGDPSAAAIEADLDYLTTNYADDPAYLWRESKPVIFVYNSGDTSGANSLQRWSDATAGYTTWYVVSKVFSGYTSATPQPDSWHQYGPSTRESVHSPYSYVVSPGYWQANDPDPPGGEFPYLARDPAAFATAVANMDAATTYEWHLITTFNEWGEGTAIEPATEFGDLYLDILAVDGNIALPSPPAAAATVSAPAPLANVRVNAGVATVGVAAHGVTGTVATGAQTATVGASAPAALAGISVPTQVASASVAAHPAGANATTNAGIAAVAAAAQPATVNTSDSISVFAGVATVGVAASDPGWTARVSAEIAAVTASAPAAFAGAGVPAGVATAGAAANGVTVAVQAGAEAAAVGVAAQAPAARVVASSGVAAVTAEGLAAAISTSANTQASAQSAIVAVTAPTPAAMIRVSAGVATVGVTAPAATGTMAVSAEVATAVASAPAATVTANNGALANAGVGAVSVTAPTPGTVVVVNAGVATVGVSAPSSRAGVGVSAPVATVSVSAEDLRTLVVAAIGCAEVLVQGPSAMAAVGASPTVAEVGIGAYLVAASILARAQAAVVVAGSPAAAIGLSRRNVDVVVTLAPQASNPPQSLTQRWYAALAAQDG